MGRPIADRRTGSVPVCATPSMERSSVGAAAALHRDERELVRACRGGRRCPPLVTSFEGGFWVVCSSATVARGSFGPGKGRSSRRDSRWSGRVYAAPDGALGGSCTVTTEPSRRLLGTRRVSPLSLRRTVAAVSKATISPRSPSKLIVWPTS